MQGVGRDVATLLSLLAAALRKGQQQCNLPSNIRNQDLESFPATLGATTLLFLGAASPGYDACARNAQSGVPTTIPATLPGHPGTAAGHVVTGALSSGAAGSALDPNGHNITLSCNMSWQLLWQEVVHKARRGPRAYMSCRSSRTSSCTHIASQMRSCRLI